MPTCEKIVHLEISDAITYQGVRCCCFAGEKSSQTEIAELDHPVCRDEHVGRLDVPVEQKAQLSLLPLSYLLFLATLLHH